MFTPALFTSFTFTLGIFRPADVARSNQLREPNHYADLFLTLLAPFLPTPFTLKVEPLS